EIPQQEPPSPGPSLPEIAETAAPAEPPAPAARAPSAPPRAPSIPGAPPGGPPVRLESRPRAPRIDDEIDEMFAKGSGAPIDDRARSERDDEGARSDDGEVDELDEDTAARRFGRRFMRATTDLIELGEELRGHYRQHDGIVIALALVIVFVAAQVHRRLV